MRFLAAVGAGVVEYTEVVGAITVMFGRTVRSLFPPRYDRYELLRQVYLIGVQSAPIVVLTALLTGVIMVLQAVNYVAKTGATSFAGALSGLAVLSELGPSLIGLMFSGRVGANTAAELGNMVVSEQIDALRALAIDPLRFLVVPRTLAIVLCLVLLTAVGDLCGIAGSAVTCHFVLHIDWHSFVTNLLETDMLDAFVVGLAKAAAFGVVIATVSTTCGLRVTGGARGVGRAVNGCVVTTALGIFLADYAITWLWFKWMGI